MLEGLNDKQLEAVTTIDGPLLVLAGAGSGKTRVLTTRIIYLILEKNINPYNILAITFTNKAALEMKNRIYSNLGKMSSYMQVSTFHSFGLSILKSHYKLLGYKSNFTIMDSDDTTSIVRKILKDMNLDPKQFNPKMIKNSISGAKNELISPSQYEKYANSEIELIIQKVYYEYERRLKTNNSLDFDDLLILPLKLFKEYPDVLKEYQNRFQYVLIDEYQDTNEAQYQLAKMISEKHKNICVVGDIDQSIYSFRGANYRNILNFEKDYPNAKIIKLEENYRSSGNILNAANKVIKNNVDRKEKNLWTSKEDGLKIQYHRSYDEKDEAHYVMGEIKKLIKNKEISLNEIAILYRTNAQSRIMEEEFLVESIPYRVVGSYYFYSRKEIKDLISYLKLIYNENDDVSLLRVINTPKRGIGLKAIETLTKKANLEGKSIFEVLSTAKELEFKKVITDIKEIQDKLSLTELVDLVLESSGIKTELVNEKSLEADIRLENLEEFKSITKRYEENIGIVSLDSFLEEISLVADITEHKESTDQISLMTVHSVKGLEFDYVFIIGLEENIFPHLNAMMSKPELEEERRLCYVALTRARKQVYITNARRRMLFGNLQINAPSRFIEEIGPDYLDYDDEELFKTSFKVDDTVNEIEIEYNKGDFVHHNIFGNGVIIEVENKIVKVAFPHPHGVKSVIKQHKNLWKVE